MENEFGMKELEQVVLKPTYPIEIDGKTIATGEVIAFFDKITLSQATTTGKIVQARGGAGNFMQVEWRTVNQVNFALTQGIFNRTQFAIMSNTKLIKEAATSDELLLSQREELESSATGDLVLKEEPAANIFIYKKTDGSKIETFTQSGKTINIELPYEKVILDYQFYYTEGLSRMIIGKNITDGYLTLEGRTRVKDDITGHTKTGILLIPRLKLMSDLSIMLGREANPVVGNFYAVGHPVGARGQESVASLCFLNDDIDSDI